MPNLASCIYRTLLESVLLTSFVFQVADNATLYGVCVFVPEMVQRAPAFFSMSTELSPQRSSRGRFLISAPRCYCLLTRVPYFDLHFEVLNRLFAAAFDIFVHERV